MPQCACVRRDVVVGDHGVAGNEGAVLPVGSRNGRELFFRTEHSHRILAVSYTAKGDSFVADKPRMWSEKPLGLV